MYHSLKYQSAYPPDFTFLQVQESKFYMYVFVGLLSLSAHTMYWM